MPAVLNWLKGFKPQQSPVNHHEKLRACLGAMLGILVSASMSAWLLGAESLPFLIAPLGASAVLLYAVPASPLAQPWSIMGGNLISAMAGIASLYFIPSIPVAAAVAVALAISLMFALRCLHPPGGAVALTAVLSGSLALEHTAYFLLLVILNSGLLLLVALAYNNATRRRYPHLVKPEPNTHKTGDVSPSHRIGFTSDDLDAVLKQYNQVLDIARDDLEDLLLQTEMQAYKRRFGEITCGDIMSRDVVSVEYGTLLEEAWPLLLNHHIKALPVVDRARRIIGIITRFDFMKHANLDVYPGFEEKLRQFVRRTFQVQTEQPEVVGQIMTSKVMTVSTNTHIVELVSLLSEHGIHHVPVLDQERRLAGIVTQTDLIAALYRGRLEETTR
ncbi:CBS domain-containing membrane protein [Methylobacillus rhizosphaerae]|uniref:CBS domain-containing membrane protein n=1 Tax=Methylobacillus rhizosphaerae TaxID=551994 RepID=A0A238ZEE7_9PROT|nr:HPP family protein [Methylobacillus rhizosphaerae]SNR81462.1 CBS domain-containing membrane protein [Methylobacillus rhizosphaerae]